MPTYYTKSQKQRAGEQLLSFLKPGSRIYLVLRHRAESRMSIVFSLLTVSSGELYDLSHSVGVLLGIPMKTVNGRDGVRKRGPGETGSETVSALAQALFGSTSALTAQWI